jgi:drug/metabolite transporter (DMT)-like permease
VVGALSYSTLVFGAAATYVVWNEELPPAEIGGIAVIIASGLMAMRVEKKEAVEEAGFES